MARGGQDTPPELARAGITPRELEVLRCVVQRLSNREIAERLIVSSRTVESHVSALLAKLGVTTRRELAARGAALLDQPAAAGGSGLPVALNHFVGRARELGEIAALLSSGRLVTLTGPGGIGKTRLALEVGRGASVGYRDGARVVDLTPARQEAGVADRVLAALGVGQVPGQAALDTLAANGSDRAVLVVLDNCEHVLSGCAVLVEKLLGHWPAVGVLATSREPLGVPGELVYQLHTLAVPDAQAVEPAGVIATDAVRLLVDRARSAGTGFAVTDANAAAVALLCRRLDGLPLALELIAPRLRTFTPEQLVGRLDDRLALLTTGAPGVPSRHRTLRRAIDWSFETLSGPERSLFTALAVFAGSFSLDSAEAICTDFATDPMNVVETLPRLVERSLVVTVPAGTSNRYRLLETLRDYAHERLDPAAARSLWNRHAKHFLGLAERAEPQLRGARESEWLDRLRAEQDNVAAALEWSLTHQRTDALRFVGALSRFWEDTDQRRSGIDWAERALVVDAAPSTVRMQALLATADLVAPWDAIRLGELAAEADDLAQRLGDDRLLAHAKICLASAKGYATAPTEMDTAQAEVAISYFRTAGDRWHTARGLQAMSGMQPPEQSLQSLDEARRLYAAEGDRFQAANCAFMMASILVRDLGNPAPAQQLARDALDVFEQLGSEHEQAHARSILAEIDHRNGKTQRAADTALDCLETFRRLADHRCESAMLLLLAGVAQGQDNSQAACRLLRETLDVAILGAHARTLPLALEGLARLLSSRDPLAAIALFAARESYRDTAGRRPQSEPAAELDAVRQATSPAAFDAAWQRGAHATLEDIVAIADEATDGSDLPYPSRAALS
jgi:predicted ATPase/DNA-binding CsgD family transcriptional regulator